MCTLIYDVLQVTGVLLQALQHNVHDVRLAATTNMTSYSTVNDVRLAVTTNMTSYSTVNDVRLAVTTNMTSYSTVKVFVYAIFEGYTNDNRYLYERYTIYVRF